MQQSTLKQCHILVKKHEKLQLFSCSVAALQIAPIFQTNDHDFVLCECFSIWLMFPNLFFSCHRQVSSSSQILFPLPIHFILFTACCALPLSLCVSSFLKNRFKFFREMNCNASNVRNFQFKKCIYGALCARSLRCVIDTCMCVMQSLD